MPVVLRPYKPHGFLLAVKVTPKSSQNALKPLTPEAQVLHVTVQASPENGLANDALVQVLAKALHLPPSRLKLVKGASSRNKVIWLNQNWSWAMCLDHLVNALGCSPECFQAAN